MCQGFLQQPGWSRGRTYIDLTIWKDENTSYTYAVMLEFSLRFNVLMY